MAWYWRMVIMVDAGAVAEPMAPSSSAKGTGSRNTKIMVSATAAAAKSASASVITKMRRALARSRLSLKYLPTPKAI